MHRRHRLDVWWCKDHRNALKRVVCNVAGTNSEIHDLTHSHEDSFECGLIAGSFDRQDVTDDERGGDLVDLLAAQGSDDVVFEASSFFFIRNDSSFFEPAPQAKSVIQDVP